MPVRNIPYSVSPEIFERFPDFRRGVVIANNVENGSSPEDLIASLREAERDLSTYMTADKIITHPHIESWREAYRSLGVKPSEFRPSVEALVRRVVRKDALPAINKIVDIGNLVSIQHLVPIGAHATDVLTQGIELRLATGGEIFEPFGTDVIEHPLPAEVIFVEGNTVLTRRWTWRQAKHTLVIPETTSIEVNVDGLPPLSEDTVRRICDQVAALIQKYCGGETRVEILSRAYPSIHL